MDVALDPLSRTKEGLVGVDKEGYGPEQTGFWPASRAQVFEPITPAFQGSSPAGVKADVPYRSLVEQILQ
jgi:hypothetical protein